MLRLKGCDGNTMNNCRYQAAFPDVSLCTLDPIKDVVQDSSSKLFWISFHDDSKDSWLSFWYNSIAKKKQSSVMPFLTMSAIMASLSTILRHKSGHQGFGKNINPILNTFTYRLSNMGPGDESTSLGWLWLRKWMTFWKTAKRWGGYFRSRKFMKCILCMVNLAPPSIGWTWTIIKHIFHFNIVVLDVCCQSCENLRKNKKIQLFSIFLFVCFSGENAPKCHQYGCHCQNPLKDWCLGSRPLPIWKALVWRTISNSSVIYQKSGTIWRKIPVKAWRQSQ